MAHFSFCAGLVILSEMFGKKLFASKYIVAFIFVICVLILVGVYFFNSQTPKEKQILDDVAIMAAVDLLTDFPAEKPIIATIHQADIVASDKPFYAGAQDGDKLIIFPKSQQAIIYSISRNVIVNYGPFVIGGINSN